MANPQCENGYTRIANEILEALSKIRIPKRVDGSVFTILQIPEILLLFELVDFQG